MARSTLIAANRSAGGVRDRTGPDPAVDLAMVRAGSARHREATVPAGMSGHDRYEESAGHHTFLARTSGSGTARRRVRIPPPQTPSIQPTTLERAAGFKRRAALGTTMPVTRDSPSIQGDVPGPDSARAPPSKAVAGRGSLVRGSVYGAFWVWIRGDRRGRGSVARPARGCRQGCSARSAGRVPRCRPASGSGRRPGSHGRSSPRLV
jgi:hypothetical protein